MCSYLMAGAWQVNITPPLGISLAGSFSNSKASEILDDLYARAVFISDGACEIMLISVDVCTLPDGIYKEIAKEIEKNCGIPAAHVVSVKKGNLSKNSS